MRRMLSYAKAVSVLLLLAGMLVGYQNCGGSAALFSGATASGSGSGSGSGNGDSYTGKPGYYQHEDPAEICSQKTAAGKPFPTRQIFVQSTGYTLVRDHCQDVEPIQIPRAELKIDPATDTIIYRGHSFTLKPNLSEYNVVPMICPAGKSVTSNTPPNLYVDPLDFTSAAWVGFRPQLPAALFGSISALPRFLIEVTSPNPADRYDWMRIAQEPAISRNTDYAISYLLQPGTLDRAIFRYDEHNGNFVAVGVDLRSGTATLSSGSTLSATWDVRRYGNAWLVTIFLRSANGTSSDAGWSAWRGDPADPNDQVTLLGDSIYATAASWRPLSSYCSP